MNVFFERSDAGFVFVRQDYLSLYTQESWLRVDMSGSEARRIDKTLSFCIHFASLCSAKIFDSKVRVDLVTFSDVNVDGLRRSALGDYESVVSYCATSIEEISRVWRTDTLKRVVAYPLGRVRPLAVFVGQDEEAWDIIFDVRDLKKIEDVVTTSVEDAASLSGIHLAPFPPGFNDYVAWRQSYLSISNIPPMNSRKKRA